MGADPPLLLVLAGFSAPYVSDITPNNGPKSGGTTVTIKGTALGLNRVDVVSITVGNVTCNQIFFGGSLELRCVTGASATAGRGPVIVVTTSGGVSTSSAFYTYNEGQDLVVSTPPHPKLNFLSAPPTS